MPVLGRYDNRVGGCMFAASGGTTMRLILIALAVMAITSRVEAQQAHKRSASAISSPRESAEQPSVGDFFEPPATTAPDVFKWKFRGWRYAGRGAAIGIGRVALF